MVAKRKVSKNQLPLSLLVVAATAVLLTLIYFVYRGLLPHSKCESIFEQTADRLRSNLDVVKMNGDLVLGPEKVQELTEGSQKVALHLKTCCIALEARTINADQFQVCIAGAKDYETKIVQVATNIKEVKAAEEQRKPEVAEQKAGEAKGAADEALLQMLKTISQSIKEVAAAKTPGDDALLQMMMMLKQSLATPTPKPGESWMPRLRSSPPQR